MTKCPSPRRLQTRSHRHRCPRRHNRRRRHRLPHLPSAAAEADSAATPATGIGDRVPAVTAGPGPRPARSAGHRPVRRAPLTRSGATGPPGGAATTVTASPTHGAGSRASTASEVGGTAHGDPAATATVVPIATGTAGRSAGSGVVVVATTATTGSEDTPSAPDDAVSTSATTADDDQGCPGAGGDD